MSDEHITTSPDGSVSHTTVSGGSSGGAGWLFGPIAVVLIGFAVYHFAMQPSSSSRKDNAITAAAQDVGKAAKDVGNAAQDAASNAKKP